MTWHDSHIWSYMTQIFDIYKDFKVKNPVSSKQQQQKLLHFYIN